MKGNTESERTASYRRLRAMGMRAIRLDFSWSSLEPVGAPLHDYVWARQDSEVRAIRNAGLAVMGILAYGQPDYSRAGGATWMAAGSSPRRRSASVIPSTTRPTTPRASPASPRTWPCATAGRSRAGEVWNEENEGWRFWEPMENPAAYGRLLCAAYRSLKRVDAHAPVALGGLFFPPLGGAVGTGGAKFLGQLLSAGGRSVGSCFDAVAYHPYPYPFTSPEAEVSDRGSVIGAAAQLRSVLRRHRAPGAPLWDTEVGWPTNPSSNGVTEARQSRYAARTQLLSWARAVPVVTWYTWGDAADPGGTNQEAHFGFFRVDGSPKPAYRALVTLNRLLGAPGWRFVADRSRALGLPRGRRGVNEGFALEFHGPGGRQLLALWYANGSRLPAAIRLPRWSRGRRRSRSRWA